VPLKYISVFFLLCQKLTIVSFHTASISDRVDARGTALRAGSVTCTDVESPLFELLIDACPDIYGDPDGPFNIYVNCNVATCPTDPD
jgi:hypothetical protein